MCQALATASGTPRGHSGARLGRTAAPGAGETERMYAAGLVEATRQHHRGAPPAMPLAASVIPEDARQDGLRWWENDRFAIGWKGHLYLPGEAAGAPSVARIGAALGSADFAEVAARAAGVFGLFVHDKRRGGWQAPCCMDAARIELYQ